MARKHPTEEINAALAAAIGRPRSVLSVGAGTGVSAMAASRGGARVTGIERNPQLVCRARRLLAEVIEADPEDPRQVALALKERRFDLIMVPDLLERAASPDELVKCFAGYLAPEGRLIVSVRNGSAWPARLGWQTPELGYPASAPGSGRLFTRRQATELVQAAGLELLGVDLNPMLLKAARAILHETYDLSLRHGEVSVTGLRDLHVYQMYLALVRPLEVAVARLAPHLLAHQHVVIARRQPQPRPLTVTVGMLTMDEEPSIARMIDEVRRAAPDARILCVDSSIQDRTPAIAERLGAQVLRQLPPRGHGPAMELLMYEAAKQSDALIYLDCDFTYPPAVIAQIRRILERGVDVVNAARTRTRPAAMPVANYLANKSFVYCARALNGIKLSDLHSGMRGYRSSVIRSFAFSGEGDALPIDTLLWPARSGYRVVEVPIEYQERVGFSKLRKLAGTLWTFIRLGKALGVGTRRLDTYEVWESLDG